VMAAFRSTISLDVEAGVAPRFWLNTGRTRHLEFQRT